jgi:geranylgeranyl diphosphate synthase type I
MVGGKTAALLAASTEIGALAASADQARRQAYRRFGYSLGLAFQAQDDILGIWGDTALTGKSSESDLAAGKKSLPIIYGLQQRGPFAVRWMKGSIDAADAPALATQLETEGARRFAQDAGAEMTSQALEALESAAPQGEAGQALMALADQLLNRSG